MAARFIGAAAAFFCVNGSSPNHRDPVTKTSSSGDQSITPLSLPLSSPDAGDG
jgi:hypothetical protein